MGWRYVYEDCAASISKSYAYQSGRYLIADSIKDRKDQFPLLLCSEYSLEGTKIKSQSSSNKTYYCRVFGWGNVVYVTEDLLDDPYVKPFGTYPFGVRESAWIDDEDSTTYVPGLTSGSVLFETTQSYDPESEDYDWYISGEHTEDGRGYDNTFATAYKEKPSATRMSGRVVMFNIVVPANPTPTGSFSSLQSNASSEPDDWADADYEQIQNSIAIYHRYLGRDVIDPTDIEYSKHYAHANKSIGVIITPSEQKVYSGTVQYGYEYSVDGGRRWTSVMVDGAYYTTRTSITIDVPDPPTDCTFQVRVRVTDGLGYGNYVSGPVIPLIHLLAYVGVDGKAKTVNKMYIGVGGTAKIVEKAYIGVNDTAIKIL